MRVGRGALTVYFLLSSTSVKGSVKTKSGWYLVNYSRGCPLHTHAHTSYMVMKQDMGTVGPG